MTQQLVKQAADRTEKRIHVALPVRVTYFDAEARPRLEMACTYDISSHGARVTGLRCVKEAGEILVVERGRSKAYCRVVWVGESASHLHGQVGIQCVESEKTLWAAELHDMGEVYDPIARDTLLNRLNSGAGNHNGNRRRYPRFVTSGMADLLRRGAGTNYLDGALKDISESGCMVTTQSVILPGTDLKLVLKVANYDLSVKGQVRHAALDVGLGVEFREIRKGDRAILQHLLRKLAEKEKAAAGKDAGKDIKYNAKSAGVLR
ncbi:MAG: PilZ domain-containing protein [Terriglobales bacterium]